MRADVAEADRRFEVRQAARGWAAAGAIDATAKAAIDAAYPDDRSRLGLVFRVLVFGFTFMAVSSMFGLFGAILAGVLEKAVSVVFILFGVALIVATEAQIGPMKRRQGGTEAATATMGLGYLYGGILWLIATLGSGGDENAFINVALGLAVLLFGVAGHRWGYSLFAVVALVALFVLFGRMPFGRLVWISLPLALAPVLYRTGESEAVAPAHRRAADALLAVSLVFLYLALHIGSWDFRLIERLRGGSPGFAPLSPVRMVFIGATAALPLAVLAAGIAGRRRMLMNLGLVGILASIVTLRFYVHVTPLWVALIAGGVAALALALGVRRYLDSGHDHERHGLTAEPLYDDPDKRSAFEIAAGVASATPAARTISAATPGFEAGGGRTGGGGATGSI